MNAQHHLGYPSLTSALRDCGNPNCEIRPHIHRCLRCQAADELDQRNRHIQRLVDRLMEYQEELERVTPPAGYIDIYLPIELVEQIVETDRIFPALDQIRCAIIDAWRGNKPR